MTTTRAIDALDRTSRRAARGWRAWVAGLARLAALAAALLPLASAALVLDFEGDLGAVVQQGARAPATSAPDAAQIDCTVSRRGRCALRTKLAVEDGYYSYGAYRVEWDFMTSHTLRYSHGDKVFYAFSVMLPPDWTFDDRAFIDIVWQFKAFGPRPDAFVAVKGTELVLRGQDGLQVSLVPRIPTGRWVDVRLKVHWSADADGRIEYSAAVQDDPQPPVAGVINGANLKTRAPRNGYITFGIYKPGVPPQRQWGSRSVLMDNIQIEPIQ